MTGIVHTGCTLPRHKRYDGLCTMRDHIESQGHKKKLRHGLLGRSGRR